MTPYRGAPYVTLSVEPNSIGDFSSKLDSLAIFFRVMLICTFVEFRKGDALS